MSADQERLQLLYHKYINNSATETELTEFWTLISETKNGNFLTAELDKLWDNLPKADVPNADEIEQRIISHVLHQPKRGKVVQFAKYFSGLRRIAAIVFLFTFFGLATYYIVKEKNATTQVALDIEPGKDGAVLTLANGEVIVLDSMANGIITNKEGADVLLDNNQLSYVASDDQAPELYNTISTPRGRQFQLTLADGTKIWLNASSSLRFPTKFTGDKRKVEVTGEAYFEVAKNAKQPFLVSINKCTEVEVLGTHFNISAYEDEDKSFTTLLEGSVRLSSTISDSKKSMVVLKPGEQGQVEKQYNTTVKVVKTDIDQVIAWKNGLFNFNDKNLKEVMRELSRWYNIDIIYQDKVPEIEFWGEMNRNLKLSEVLHILKKSDVHFKIQENRKLLVLP